VHRRRDFKGYRGVELAPSALANRMACVKPHTQATSTSFGWTLE
jgi:hypothetical protein